MGKAQGRVVKIAWFHLPACGPSSHQNVIHTGMGNPTVGHSAGSRSHLQSKEVLGGWPNRDAHVRVYGVFQHGAQLFVVSAQKILV